MLLCCKNSFIIFYLAPTSRFNILANMYWTILQYSKNPVYKNLQFQT